MSVPRYWRNMPKRERLESKKCEKCGHVDFPPRARCLKCGSDALIPYTLPDRGKLMSFTIVRSAPKGFEKMTPYVLGVVELIDSTSITVQITDVDPSDVAIGMPLESVFRKVCEDGDSGIIEYAIKFRPAV